MPSTLIDAGPIIALFDRDDHYHKSVIQFLKTYKGQLISTWPVLTEVAHMLDFSTQTQLNALRWVERGGVKLIPLEAEHLERIITLTEKYQDVPMDLADSSLVVMAEELNLTQIITIDSDYYVYRIGKQGTFTNLLEPYLRP